MEYFLTEMQYGEYAAKEELIDSLTDLAECYLLPNLTLEQVEILNELSLASVGVYVTKVSSSIAKAWADFQAGFQDSMWISYKKIHGSTFKSSFVMRSAESGITLPKLDEIRKFMETKLPTWKGDVENKDLPDKEAFYKLNSSLSVLYDKEKSVQDKVNELYFVERKGSIEYPSSSLINYISFMNDYGKLKDHVSSDIKQNKIDADTIKAEAVDAQNTAKKAEEKAKQEQEKAKQEAEKAKVDAEKEKENAEREAERQKAQADQEAKSESTVFNFAEALLEAVVFAEEGNKFEASDNQSETTDTDTKTEEKPAGPLSDDDFKAKLDKITIFFTGCTEVLSAKMKALNKARSLSFDLIKQYCKLAEPSDKEKKKAEKKVAKGEEKPESKEAPEEEKK